MIQWRQTKKRLVMICAKCPKMIDSFLINDNKHIASKGGGRI